ncbi:hypothetical protein LXA43DRAFT_493757 [Ganoderma leucocontextum]|nr:hypothetical protein LXA43DRAFT_493757 [Ganoderma leucocontextum]
MLQDRREPRQPYTPSAGRHSQRPRVLSRLSPSPHRPRQPLLPNQIRRPGRSGTDDPLASPMSTCLSSTSSSSSLSWRTFYSTSVSKMNTTSSGTHGARCLRPRSSCGAPERTETPRHRELARRRRAQGQSTNDPLKKSPQSVQDAIAKGEAEDGQAWPDATMAFYARYGCRVQPFPAEVINTLADSFGENGDRTVLRAG